MTRARLLPKDMALPPPACIWRMKKIHTPMSKSMGNQETRMVTYHGVSSFCLTRMLTPALRSAGIKVSSWGMIALNALPLEATPLISSPWMRT